MYYKYILTIIFFLYSIILSIYLTVHTDEYWTYASLFYYSEGNKTYLDYFNHRLPLLDLFYGSALYFLPKKIIYMRVISVLFATASLYFFLDKIKNVNSKIIIFLLYCQPICISMFSTVTTYSISNFISTISVYYLINGNIIKFQISNTIFYLTRYFIDFSIVVGSFISGIIYYSRRNLVLSIIIPAIIFLILYAFYGENVYYHTFEFNKNSFYYMSLAGINDGYYYDPIRKFIFLRKLELMNFYGLYVIFLISSIYIIINKINNNAVKSLYIYIVAMYIFYYITLNDFPITKIYAVPFVIGLWMIAENYVSKNIKIIIIVILAIGLFQHNYKISDMQIIDICNKINCSKKSFATNPIINTRLNSSNKKFIMELYSLAQGDPEKYHLYDSNQIINDIMYGEYNYIILDDRFHSRKNMSLMISNIQYDKVDEFLKFNYFCKEIYRDYKLDRTIYIYEKKIN
jgi:hypothetical protein